MDEKPEWWASPAVLGLMGFGLTTMMAGLSNLPSPYGNGFTGNWAIFGLAIAFGGVAQIIAGIIGLRKGNLFAGTAFVGYGAFWLSFTMIASTIPAGLVFFYGLSAFAFLWMMFTLTFLINSMKHGWGMFFLFLFLFVSFALLVAKYWQLASNKVGYVLPSGEAWAVGGLLILTGLTAWYVATADLTNWNYGRKVLPV